MSRSSSKVGRRLYLTDAGRRLYESCQEVFRAFTTLEESLAGMRALESGRLRLAVSTTGMCFAPRLLGAFVESHPGIETSMQAHNRQMLVERLANNEDDLYLFADAPEMEDVVAQELLPNPRRAGARRPSARRGKDIPFEHLVASEPFLIREAGSGARRIAMRLFGEHRLDTEDPDGTRHRTRRSRRRSSRASASPSCHATPSASIRNRRDSCVWTSRASRSRTIGIWRIPEASSCPPVARAFLDFSRAEAKGGSYWVLLGDVECATD